LEYVGISLDYVKVKKDYSKTFETKNGRQPGEENRNVFFRRGISDAWKDYYDAKCIDEFQHATVKTCQLG
jgi:hypothetical protein